MSNRNENRERDEWLDAQIDRLLSGNLDAVEYASGDEQVAHEFARLAAEESPRLSNAARTQGIQALRAAAAQKRAARRPNPFAWLFRAPRWALLSAVVLVVVIVANGVSSAAADALPGTFLYPFKRFGEGGQLFFQNTNAERARLWMNFANTRLDEVQRLLAGGERVDPAYLDAVDDSILRALAELAGTRGDERVALLQNLTALAMRQQQIVKQLAVNASPDDRARLEQTEKLLQGVATYAASPDAQIGPELNPFEFLTPSPIPTNEPTQTPANTSTLTPLLFVETTQVPGEQESESPTEMFQDADEETPTRAGLPSRTAPSVVTEEHQETETPQANEDQSGKGSEDKGNSENSKSNEDASKNDNSDKKNDAGKVKEDGGKSSEKEKGDSNSGNNGDNGGDNNDGGGKDDGGNRQP